MTDNQPSPLELLAAAIRDDPERWLQDSVTSSHTTSLEEEVSKLDTVHYPESPTREPSVDPLATSRSKRRARHALVAAAVVAAFSLSVLLVNSRTPSALATVTKATNELSNMTSLEGHLSSASPSFTSRSTIRTIGDAIQVQTETTYADGHTEASEQVIIDGFIYETTTGRTTREPVAPHQVPAPFARSSAAVIKAALTDARIVLAGSENIGSVATTRYDVELSGGSIKALSGLEPNELSWFELENPDRVEYLRLWISDGDIKRLEVQSGVQHTQVEFQQVNADTSISAPTGPYHD